MTKYVVCEYKRDDEGNTVFNVSHNVYNSLLLAEKELKSTRDDIANDIESDTQESFKHQTEYIIDVDNDSGLCISKDDSLYLLDLFIHKMEERD